MRNMLLGFLLLAAGLARPIPVLFSQQVAPPAENAPQLVQPETVDFDARLNQLTTDLLLKHVPHTYTDTRKWGLQEERKGRVRIRREGWKLETKRKRIMVNHGTWRKYSVRLVNPDENVRLSVLRLRGEDGKLALDLHLDALLAVDARQAKWVNGVQLYSLNAEGSARVRLTLQLEIDFDLRLEDTPMRVALVPKAQAAALEISDFKIDRVSKLGGELAQQVTEAAREKLDEKVGEFETKLVDKINKEIAKQNDKLVFDLSRARESELARSALPHLETGSDANVSDANLSPGKQSRANPKTGEQANRSDRLPRH